MTILKGTKEYVKKRYWNNQTDDFLKGASVFFCLSAASEVSVRKDIAYSKSRMIRT